jgi:uncharacterized protein YukE
VSVLTARPEDLRSAARSLALAQCELADLAARLARSETSTTGTWQGVAALGQRAATGRLHVAVLRRCDPLGVIARAVDELADQAAESQEVMQAARVTRAEAQAERQRHLVRLGTLVDPAEAAAVLERVASLEVVICRAGDQISGAQDAMERARHRVDQVLRDSWVGMGWDDLSDLARAGQALAPVWRGSGLVVVGTRLLLASARLAKELDPVARHLLEGRMRRLLSVVMKPPFVALLAGSLGRVVVPVFVISDAWPDVLDGGGYAGWRGMTVRVTAGLAIPGSVAMIVPHPAVAGVGAVTVGAYYLVKGGNLIYDRRLTIASAGALVWRHRARVQELAQRLMTPSPAFPLGPLGPILPGVGSSDGLLPGLPVLDQLRRFVPDVGGPLPWADVPIGPGLRLPVVPPPTLSGLTPVVLSHLRRLF